ncbi:hypothetical protein ACFFJB_03890 [Camelimonas abortus]|uniref:Uncharacterized protein n=1 Tax=Camelimonas abortus TaxID=1017184 RepID=A0ABV7LDC0_9HYPH
MIDVDALRAELRDIDGEIAEVRRVIRANNSENLLRFGGKAGGVIGALLDNTPHFERYEALRDLRERLLVSLAAIDPAHVAEAGGRKETRDAGA